MSQIKIKNDTKDPIVVDFNMEIRVHKLNKKRGKKKYKRYFSDKLINSCLIKKRKRERK